MATLVTKDQIGLEDINFGNGTFSRATSTGSTQNITKMSRGRKVFNVLDYGVTGLGVADEAANTLLAVTAAAAVGGVVHFPDGTYLYSTSVAVPSNVTFSGVSNTGIDANNKPTGSIIKRDAAIKIFDFSGTDISTGRLGNIAFENLYFLDGSDVGVTDMVYGKWADSVQFRNCLFETPLANTSNASMVAGEQCKYWRFRDCDFVGGGDVTGVDGAVRIADGTTASNISSDWSFHGCNFIKSKYSSVRFDTTGQGSAGIPERIVFVDCLFTDPGAAYSASSALEGTARNVRLIGCDFKESASVFLTIESASQGWTIAGCSFDNTTDKNHIDLIGDCCTIIGNEFNDFGSASHFINYQVFAANNVVMANNARDDGTLVGGITLASNKNIMNPSFVTESSGTGTVLNGTTSIAVTHSLDYTPVAGNIMVTPAGSLGAASKFWIDTYTSTQFTINVDADPGADVTFVWSAQRLRG